MKDRIKKVMASVFKIDQGKIMDNINPDTVENWDSLNHINLVLALEKEFGIKIVGEEVIGMISLDNILKVVEEKTGQKLTGVSSSKQ